MGTRTEFSDPDMDVRLTFKAEIADSISGITDRDHFLQRLVRRIADVTGVSRAAIYTRSGGNGDLLLRSNTFPRSERITPRLSADPVLARREALEYTSGDMGVGQSVILAPIGDLTGIVGAILLFSEPGQRFSQRDQHMLDDIAAETAPAIIVAEHHHAVKQNSVIDLATGAYANWYVTQRFDEEIARASRMRNSVTVIVASVLDFEHLQRTIGYDLADEVLRVLAEEFSGLTRASDVVGMRSRSEYAILLPGTDFVSGATVIARIHQRAMRVIDRMQAEHPGISAQIVTGAASFPDDGDRASTVLLAAEHRLGENEMQHRRTVSQL